MEPNQAKDLQDAIEAARQSLAAEGQGETDTGTKTFDSPESELEYLRGRERERTEQAAVSKMVAEVAAGVKSQQAAETERLSRLVQSELEKALGGDAAKNLLTDAVARASALRTGRKFVPDSTGDVGAGYGAKGGGTYIPGHHLGEKPDFGAFLRAVARKDRSAIGDIQRSAGLGQKALVSGGGAISDVTGPSGGYLVPVEFSQEILTKLVPQVTVRRAGARILNLDSPIFRQPRLTSGASAAWVGETAAIASSQQTLDQFELTAKKLAALVPVSNELLQDSSPAVSDIVMEDMARAIGLLEDYTFLLGAGSSTTPAGLLTLDGIDTDSWGTDPSYQMILDFIYALESANVPEINRVWVCHPQVRKALAGLLDKNDRPLFQDYAEVQVGTVTQRVPTLFGYPLLTTTQMTYESMGPTGSLALVDFGYVRIGQVRELELKTSDEASFVDGSAAVISSFQSDLTLFRATLREDVSTIHPESIILRSGINV